MHEFSFSTGYYFALISPMNYKILKILPCFKFIVIFKSLNKVRVPLPQRPSSLSRSFESVLHPFWETFFHILARTKKRSPEFRMKECIKHATKVKVSESAVPNCSWRVHHLFQFDRDGKLSFPQYYFDLDCLEVSRAFKDSNSLVNSILLPIYSSWKPVLSNTVWFYYYT